MITFFKYFAAAILMAVSSIALGQHQVDKIIDAGIYKSYYCYKIKNPLYVTYPLYKGGGPCDRAAEGFSFTKCGEETASGSDYTNSGYEKGHLANAEDFAKNCTIEKETFCYYNCVPQTRVLNHGKWLHWESEIRTLSKTKHLFIVTGGIYGNKHIKAGSKVIVPEYCYKIVIDAQTKATLYCLLFKNDNSDQMEELSLTALKRKLSYPLLPENALSIQ
jgi:endonuclease G